ncbi:MAG: Fe-S cluster assembly protein SufD [Gammaproteobacteria bacterium]
MSRTAIEHYLSQHSRLQNAAGASWLLDQQNSAIKLFEETGFPTRKMEDWKYTDVQPILKRDFTINRHAARPVDVAALDAARITGLDCHELVFINGHFVSADSNLDAVADGIILKPLQQAITDNNEQLRQHLNQYANAGKNGFSALNTAFLDDGVVIIVPENMTVDKPVHIIYLSEEQDTYFSYTPRNLIVLGKHARATVIETYTGSGEAQYFTNTLTEISLQAGATLEHYKLQQEGLKGFHVGSTQVHQHKDSRFLSHSISLGGKLVRNDIDVRLQEAGAEVMLNGLYMADKSQHIDNHTRVDHLSPHTSSSETYRGVLSGRSRGVFNGKVIVHKDAQKTDAHQSNANLLLSNDAEVDTKPELEIYADDVKCSHGATIGQLDETMLFYLRSRAIEEDTARSLLTFAFAEDVIRRIQLAPVRKRIESIVVGRLPDADLIKEFVQ